LSGCLEGSYISIMKSGRLIETGIGSCGRAFAESIGAASTKPQCSLSLVQFQHDGRFSSHCIRSVGERFVCEKGDTDFDLPLLTFIAACLGLPTRSPMPYRLAVCINVGVREIDIKLRKSEALDECFGIRSSLHIGFIWGTVQSCKAR